MSFRLSRGTQRIQLVYSNGHICLCQSSVAFPRNIPSQPLIGTAENKYVQTHGRERRGLGKGLDVVDLPRVILSPNTRPSLPIRAAAIPESAGFLRRLELTKRHSIWWQEVFSQIDVLSVILSRVFCSSTPLAYIKPGIMSQESTRAAG